MSRAYAMALRSPHISLGLPVHVGRKFEVAARRTWIGVMLLVTLSCMGVYLFQVNRAASKGFTLRTLEKQLDQLTTEVEALENQSARQQSLSSIEVRVRDMGYVPVDRMEFVDIPHGFAVANVLPSDP